MSISSVQGNNYDLDPSDRAKRMQQMATQLQGSNNPDAQAAGADFQKLVTDMSSGSASAQTLTADRSAVKGAMQTLKADGTSAATGSTQTAAATGKAHKHHHHGGGPKPTDSTSGTDPNDPFASLFASGSLSTSGTSLSSLFGGDTTGDGSSDGSSSTDISSILSQSSSSTSGTTTAQSLASLLSNPSAAAALQSANLDPGSLFSMAV